MQSETITRTKRWRVQWVTLCDLVAGITQQCEIWRRYAKSQVAQEKHRH